MLEFARMFTLASNSPRRKELLSLTGWSFVVRAVDVDERVIPGEAAENYVRRISRKKALSSMELEPGAASERFILACDTAVVDGDSILGKPSSEDHAAEVLRRLRSREHQVYSAIVIIDTDKGDMYQELCVNNVPMRNYSDIEMATYIASGDPMDKAGAYAIQHPEFRPVEQLHGCFANVMGLPLCHLARTMEQLDIGFPVYIPDACQGHLGYDCPVHQDILSGEI